MLDKRHSCNNYSILGRAFYGDYSIRPAGDTSCCCPLRCHTHHVPAAPGRPRDGRRGAGGTKRGKSVMVATRGRAALVLVLWCCVVGGWQRVDAATEGHVEEVVIGHELVEDHLPTLADFLEGLSMEEYLDHFYSRGVDEMRYVLRYNHMDFTLMHTDWGIAEEHVEIIRTESQKLFVERPIVEQVEGPLLKMRRKQVYGRLAIEGSVQSYEFMVAAFGDDVPVGPHPIVAAEPLHCCNMSSNVEDLPGEVDYSGKFVVAARGNCSFVEKATVAHALNATAVIVVNTNNSLIAMASTVGAPKKTNLSSNSTIVSYLDEEGNNITVRIYPNQTAEENENSTSLVSFIDNSGKKVTLRVYPNQTAEKMPDANEDDDKMAGSSMTAEIQRSLRSLFRMFFGENNGDSTMAGSNGAGQADTAEEDTAASKGKRARSANATKNATADNVEPDFDKNISAVMVKHDALAPLLWSLRNRPTEEPPTAHLIPLHCAVGESTCVPVLPEEQSVTREVECVNLDVTLANAPDKTLHAEGLTSTFGGIIPAMPMKVVALSELTGCELPEIEVPTQPELAVNASGALTTDIDGRLVSTRHATRIAQQGADERFALLVERGGCQFSMKALFAERIGASLLLVQDRPGAALQRMGASAETMGNVSIPAFLVTHGFGERLRSQATSVSTHDSTVEDMASLVRDSGATLVTVEDVGDPECAARWTELAYREWPEEPADALVELHHELQRNRASRERTRWIRKRMAKLEEEYYSDADA